MTTCLTWMKLNRFWWCCNPALFCAMVKTAQHSTVLKDVVFSANLIPGFCSEKAAGNKCSCVLFFFSKRTQGFFVFSWVFFSFFLPADAFASAHSDSLKQSLLFWRAVATSLQQSHRNMANVWDHPQSSTLLCTTVRLEPLLTCPTPSPTFLLLLSGIIRYL